jgi:peptidyl-prolyl cis-trans isomerase A (cyclophilin A)
MFKRPRNRSPLTADVKMKRLVALAALSLVAACSPKESAKPPAATTAASTTAPDTFRVAFVTSRGPFTVEVDRALAPLGADRFYQLVTSGYFTDVRFFRVVPGFVAQFGMNGDPKVNDEWQKKTILDDSVKTTNARGTIVFATSGPNSRANQFFINLVDNTRLDGMGFAPFGRVTDGMAVVDSIYSGYGEQPDQGQIGLKGNAYLTAAFPKLDYIKSATVVAGATAAAQTH